MSKRSTFCDITPLPHQVTREIVINALHNHGLMIELSPNVIKHERCSPPQNVPADEFHCAWYEITDNMNYLPGGLLSSQLKYRGCFYNTPNGLQVHIYAPLGLDMKNRWSVGGSLPGEPKETGELGLNIPSEGLYLREDVEIRCKALLAGFSRKATKKNHSVLVQRLIAEAEVTEALHYSQAAVERYSSNDFSQRPLSSPTRSEIPGMSTVLDEAHQQLERSPESIAPPPYQILPESGMQIQAPAPNTDMIAELDGRTEAMHHAAQLEAHAGNKSSTAAELPGSRAFAVEMPAVQLRDVRRHPCDYT